MLAADLVINVDPDVTTIHDETAGLQNDPAALDASIDNNGNDIALSEVDSNTPLDTTGAIGAALNGYDGSNSGENVFTIDTGGSTITNLALTDANGDPLDGFDSGLITTADGNSIFLYTDPTNDNIVLGREGTGTTADANGNIVLAIYLDQNPNLTAGKFWTVQYEAIAHDVPGDGTTPQGSHDEPLDLTDKLFVTASRDLEFDLTNAPSGQNLFIMFGDGSNAEPQNPAEVGIVATGKKPLDQSANPGTTITAGDTVNTSQGGGKTTFGINNQMIDEREGIYFTFVTGPEPNYTVPNLDQNEADIEAKIQFLDVLDAKSAELQVVQLQSGKTAVVKISAFATTPNPGANFINASGLTGNTPVAITGVEVFLSDGVTPAPGVTITPAAEGTFTISGVKAGYYIRYSTDGAHNRVLIEHAGSGKGQNSADFDIGGFRLVEADAATAEVGSTVHWEDDGPTIDLTLAANALLQTDDGDLAGGNSGDGTGTDSDSAGVGDLFNVTESAGADGDAGTVYALELGANTTTSLVDAATDETVVLSLNGGVVEGRTEISNDLVFTLSVNSATGEVTLEQLRAVEHAVLDTAAPYNDDITGLGVSDGVKLSASITEGDGDTAKDSIDISGTLKFTDDGPTLEFGNLVGTVTTDPQIGQWSESVGADQPGTVTVTASGTFDMVTADGVTSSGTVVFDSATGTGTLTADFDNDSSNGNETIGFSLVVNPDGTYVFTLDEVILPVVTLSTDEGQLPAGGPDPVQTLTFDSTSIVFFAVDAGTAADGTNPIAAAIQLGESDLTEAELEARALPPIGNGTFPFIRKDILMNVSTSGIGVNNNVLQGEDPFAALAF